MNMTNNHLERLNGQLKDVICRNSLLEEFLQRFFVIIRSLRTEHDHRVALQFHKTATLQNLPHSPEYWYHALLTNYAAELVCKQLQLHTMLGDLVPVSGSEDYQVRTHEGLLTVSSAGCQCLFRKATGLPCHHIFAVLQKLGRDLYDEGLCIQRWLLRTCQATQRLFTAQLPMT